MTTVKNYGPATSGFLNPDGRSWETTVYQAGKPILDKELNLIQDAEQYAVLKLRTKTFPSGWVSDEFLDVTSGTSVFNGVVNTANQVTMVGMTAYLNGWLLNVANTGDATGLNVLDLGAGPSGAGAKRIDLIVLEAWRRLIPASPTGTGKSGSGRIWKDGNVKIPSGSDTSLNYADDILDTAAGAETTKRVQIQYRLRAVSNVDLFTYAFGINDPSVVAHSVPTNAATPDGTSTSYAYANQSASGDPGLWVAGDGNPANTLGTVDGFMYAMPLAVVFRRNTTAFARNTNQNGGVAYPGPSTRPDGLFTDIIVANDVLDLRTGTAPSGWDLNEVLQKNLNFLLDNQNQTEVGVTLFGGGSNGHTIMQADEIGVSNANGGDGVTTGDTPGADFIGEFDSVRRTFSDRAIYETVVLRYTPSGASWASGETITISPSNLPIWPYANTNWAAHAPSNISFVDIDRVAFLGEANGSNSADITVGSFWSISGMGTAPQGTATLRLSAAGATAGGSSPLYVTMVVAYPPGVGLTKTPTNTYADNATAATVSGVFVNNAGQLPSTSPIFFGALNTPEFVPVNREIGLTYQTVSHTRNFYSTGATMSILMPERIDQSQAVSITINSTPYSGSQTVSTDGYKVTIANGAITGGQTVVVTYQAIRPLPQNNEQLTVYYEARTAQTVRTGLLPDDLKINPKHIPQSLYVLTAGSGSTSIGAYPFPYQYVQSGGVYPSSVGTFAGDHELDGDLRISVTTMFSDTGFMQLGLHLPLVPAPDAFEFGRSSDNVDIEGRSFYPEISSGYGALAIAQPLSDPKKHKNLLPLIGQLVEDTPFGFKGQLVMVFISRWATFDDSNSVAFNGNLVTNKTSASIYRLKGNLLGNRRS